MYLALQTTGQTLIRQLTNGFLIPAEYQFGGDIGCSYVITSLAYYGNCSLEAATYYFYGLLVGAGSLIALSGLWLMAKTWQSKLISFIGIVPIALLTWNIGDEYIVSFFVASCIPLLLYSFEKRNNYRLASLLFLYGIIVVYTNFLRIHTGTMIALIIMVRLFLYRSKFLIKLLLGCMFLLGYGGAKLSLYYIFSQRNAYLNNHGYTLTTIEHQHTFWHNIYPGFGFIENNKNLYFSDTCSMEKVKSIDPDAEYLSPEYNVILRKEIFALIIKSPHFVLRCLFAKLGVIFYYLLLCLLPFLGAFSIYSMPLRIHCCYWFAMAWGALPGLLTIPNILYILGFITAAWLYGLHMMLYVLNEKIFIVSLQKTKSFFAQLFHTILHMERD